MGSILDLQALTIDYGSFRAVDALDLRTAPGEIVALLGASGCGKTTTLRAIAGLVRITSGAIAVDGERIDHVPAHRRGIGLVFQNYALFPHLTVSENVGFGLRMLGKSTKASDQERILSALRLLQVEDQVKAYPSELSGGQQQRVALARSLVTEPRVLLLDEALSALDKKLRDKMRGELRSLLKRLEITTVVVTHDQEEALTMADRVALMRGGCIEQIGTPEEIYENPNSLYSASFIGEMNGLRGKVAAGAAAELSVRTVSGDLVRGLAKGAPTAEGTPVIVCFRPEHGILDDRPAKAEEPDRLNGFNVVDGTVEAVRYTGDRSTKVIRTNDDTRVSVTTPSDRAKRVDIGAAVTVRWPIARSLVFPDEPVNS